jgi:hypothetical protein
MKRNVSIGRTFIEIGKTLYHTKLSMLTGVLLLLIVTYIGTTFIPKLIFGVNIIAYLLFFYVLIVIYTSMLRASIKYTQGIENSISFVIKTVQHTKFSLIISVISLLLVISLGILESVLFLLFFSLIILISTKMLWRKISLRGLFWKIPFSVFVIAFIYILVFSMQYFIVGGGEPDTVVGMFLPDLQRLLYCVMVFPLIFLALPAAITQQNFLTSQWNALRTTFRHWKLVWSVSFCLGLLFFLLVVVLAAIGLFSIAFFVYFFNILSDSSHNPYDIFIVTNGLYVFLIVFSPIFCAAQSTVYRLSLNFPP